jgi:hypothetical protein
MLVEQIKIVSNENHLTNNILELFLAQTLALKDVRKNTKKKKRKEKHFKLLDPYTRSCTLKLTHTHFHIETS